MSRPSEIRVAVIGAGSWATTVAALASVNTPTKLWARRDDLVDQINNAHSNPDYRPPFTLPDQLVATSDMQHTVSGADVVMAVPSHGFRGIAGAIARHLRPWVPIAASARASSVSRRCG